MTAPLIEQPVAELELRNQIAYALSNAGAFCGECGFEPGDRGKCTDCERCWTSYANALLPLLAPAQASLELEERESAHQREERRRLRTETDLLRSALAEITTVLASRDEGPANAGLLGRIAGIVRRVEAAGGGNRG